MKLYLLCVVIILMLTIIYWVYSNLGPEWKYVAYEENGYRVSFDVMDYSYSRWERLKAKIKHRDFSYSIEPNIKINLGKKSEFPISSDSKGTFVIDGLTVKSVGVVDDPFVDIADLESELIIEQDMEPDSGWIVQ